MLHIVESLAVGGAEVLLVESLKRITNQYRHIVVYMRPNTSLLSQVNAERIYCLGYKGKSNLLFCIFKLRKIIKAEHVDLIHSHHYWPTIAGRLAKPKQIPLLFTVHSLLSNDAFKLNRLSYYLEKLTFNKDQHPIFVSKAVMQDYRQHIHLEERYSVIYNFAAEVFYDDKYRKIAFSKSKLSLVAIGNLKKAKNYDYLIEVFGLLKDYDIYLDIYGGGTLMDSMVELVERYSLTKVSIKGAKDNIHEILPNYDAFILASSYEGLSIALVEAMAIGLPCALSNIASNIETSGGEAIFFDLASPQDCADKLINLLNNLQLLDYMSSRSLARASTFHERIYLDKVENLYKSYL